jgi:2-oxoisovalerate dehydrogenase E1 component
MVSTPLTTTMPSPHGALDRETLIRAFRLMYLSRCLDDREVMLKRQNKIFFQVSCAGHEAIQVAAGMALKPGSDWTVPYYRDRALVLTLGMTAEDMLLQAVGAGRDPSSGGRQMPSHWSSARLRILTGSSPTGSQYLHGLGCATAKSYLAPDSREITLVTSGEGATSEGEFWECMNIACIERAPLVVLIQDNGYAISVPVEKQTAGGNIANLLAGFPGLLRLEVDGTDFLESHRAMSQAVEHCRAGRGSSLVRATVIRPYSHSLSDDEQAYKPKAERDREAARDPLKTFPEYLMEHGILTQRALEDIIRDTDEEVQELAEKVLREPAPEPGSAYRFLYSDRVDPCSSAFETEPKMEEGRPMTMVDSINRTLAEEMRRDERVIVFGEDVADVSREEYLNEVKGKGGVFMTTRGLQREFGSKRCFNTPIAEAGIVGRAIGMAVCGLKPVPEIQFFDYIWPAMMQIRNELANIRWRSNNGFSCPMVIRVPIGGYLTGGAVYHSQCGEVAFTHIPGLRVVFPSNALDACGLLRTAIRCDDPVLFLEHKKLYREMYNRSPHPGPDYMIPFGKAKIVKLGQNLTIVTYGALVQRALMATVQLEKQYGVSVEVIDLRTLAPYDWESIKTSVKKTSRVLIAHEDTLSWGYGAEIAARIASELFSDLDAPVGRVGALDTWVAYNPNLEDEILPQVATIVKESERLLGY